MTNRLSPANLVARSAALARPLAPILLFLQRGGGTMRAARSAPLPLLAALAAMAVAAALFATYVYPAYAQEGSAPDKPRGLNATASHDAITLTWDDPQDESITGYVILRRNRDTDAKGHFHELVADTGSAATTYTDTEVAAETRYTYRIKATNEHGTSERSRWFHIDTTAAPEPPANNPATGSPAIAGTVQVGETLMVDTSGIADEDGLENAAFSYQWLADGTAIPGATASAYTPAEADEGKAVTVQVNFTDNAGNDETLTSAPTAAVAAAEPTEPPAKPTDLSATASHNQVVLTWKDPNDNSITGYVILRRIPGVDPEGQFSELVSDTGTAATTYTDGSVAAETRYTYRIKAINQYGASERSRCVHINTPAAPEPETDPADLAPANLAAELTEGQVILSWDPPAEDVGSVTGYEVLRAEGENAPATLAADTRSAAATYTDATATTATTASTNYAYSVKAIRDGERSQASGEAVVQLPPAVPTGVLSAAAHDSVLLSWSDPQDGAITGYRILRADVAGGAQGEFAAVAEDTGSADTGYTDTTVEAERSYVYRVQAIGPGGLSGPSPDLAVNTPPAPVVVVVTPADPQAPSNLAAELADGQVVLSWDAPAQDADTVTGYEVLRAEGQGELATLAADTGSTATTYTDATAASAGTSYAYRVKAIRDGERSGASNEARALLKPARPTGLSAGTVAHDTVTLAWDAPNDDEGITGYAVVRWTLGYNATGFVTIAADTGTADPSYTDETVEPENEYLYHVRAINTQGESKQSEWLRVHTPPAPDGQPPAAPEQVLSAAGHDIVLLHWADPQDDTITGYRILRANIVDQAPGEFAVLTQDTGSADTSYTDDTVEPERSYVYRVLAVSPHGVSAPSSDRRVSTPAAPTVVTPEPPDIVPPITERANVQDLGDITEQDGPQVIHDGLEGAADAADYYRFTLSEPRLVRLGLPWQEGDAVLILELEDSTRLRVGAPDGDAHASVEETMLEGTHYVRVEAQQPGENEYVFSYEVSAADPAEAARLREEGYTPDPEPGEDTEPLVGLPAETIQPRQEAEVLLSNFGQVQSSSGLIIRDSEVAQGFTTGPNILGYTLGSIELDVYGIPETPTDVTVELWSATSESTPKPNAPVATLTHSTGTWTEGLNAFDAPAGTELASDTAFFVFVSYPSTGAVDQILLRRINGTSADAGGAPGWRIRRSFSRERTPQGDWSGISITMKIQINGNQVLGPSSGDRPGTVVLSAAEPFSASQPYVGVQLTAALDDPDTGPVTGLRWQWSRSINGTDWTDINGATSSSYTPVAFTPADLDDDIAPQEDEGRYVRATANYRQAFSDQTVDQTAHGSTGAHVKFDISEPPGADFSQNQSFAGRVRVGGWVTGDFSLLNERGGDAFAVDLVSGRKYRFDLEGSPTGRGTLADPFIRNAFYFVGATFVQTSDTNDNNSGIGLNARLEFTAEATATHYIVAAGGEETRGTYRLTVQEILDDLGVWHTDWGAEEPGGFLQPNNQANGNLYGADATQRSGGQRDKDAFLFYLGSDEAPLDTDYVLAVRGLDTPQLQVETFYDLSGLDAYIDNFSLDDDFIEFPESGSGSPDPDVSDAEAGRLRSVVPQPVGTLVETSGEGEFHLVFNPGAEDLGAYLAVIKSHRKDDTGNYQLHLRQDASVSEPDGEDFANDHRTKGYVRVGDPVTGHIGDHGANTDSFATLLEGGRTYRIEAKGSETGDGTLDDPAISNIENHWPDLVSPCGGSSLLERLLACSDDDGGQGLNASVIFSPESTGLYYVVISNLKAVLNSDYSPSQEGTYTLSVTDVTGIPRIVAPGVRVTSSPASGDTYGDGEDIEITVTFSEAVYTTGSPQFEFCMGSGECRDGDDPPARRRARLTSGSGSAELVFTYRAGSGDDPDNDGNGIWIGDHTRTLKLDAGDAIRDVDTGTDAILNHDELGTQSGHKVDTS